MLLNNFFGDNGMLITLFMKAYIVRILPYPAFNLGCKKDGVLIA